MGTRKIMIAVLLLSSTMLLYQWSFEFDSKSGRIIIYPEVSISYGYVMSLRYGGQQTGAVGSLASLQCWIKSFDLPMVIAEPAVRHSKMFTTHLEGFRFGDLFDIEKFNNLGVGKREFGQIAEWGNFLEDAPRSIVFVQINDPKDEEYHSVHEQLWETSLTSVDTANCTLPPSLQFLERYKFCITQFVNFTIHGKNPFKTNDLYSPFPPEQVHKYLFQNLQPEEVTLVIDHWLPMYCIPNSKLVNPEVCRNVHYSGRSLMYASSHLLKDVQRYENLFLLPRTTLAVLIRSEHLISWAAMNCQTKEGEVNKTKLMHILHVYLDTIIDTARNIKRRQGRTFVTLDAGKYGSSSWRSMFSRGGYSELREPILQALKETLLSLDNSINTFEEWEESFNESTGGVTDPGYIAALQRTIGSRADCLILAGGGTFGLGALSEYVHHHPDTSEHCYQFLAMASKYRTLYQDAMQQLTRKKVQETLRTHFTI